MTEEAEPFWAAAREGRLLAERCRACGAQWFPPRGICRKCRSREAEPVEVTGRGQVYSLTVNHQRWLPGLEVPYAIVLVEFPAHPGVRVVGRLRGCPPEEAAIGMEVEIGFEPGPGDVVIPSFVATGDGTTGDTAAADGATADGATADGAKPPGATPAGTTDREGTE